MSRDPLRAVELLSISVGLAPIAKAVAELSPGELIDFVRALDKQAASWDVSLPLCEYFAGVRVEYGKEHREDYPHGCGKEACQDCAPENWKPATPPDGSQGGGG